MSTQGMPQFKTVTELVNGLIHECTGMRLDISSLTALTLHIEMEDPQISKGILQRGSSLKLTGLHLDHSFPEEKVTLTLRYGPSLEDRLRDTQIASNLRDKWNR